MLNVGPFVMSVQLRPFHHYGHPYRNLLLWKAFQQQIQLFQGNWLLQTWSGNLVKYLPAKLNHLLPFLNSGQRPKGLKFGHDLGLFYNRLLLLEFNVHLSDAIVSRLYFLLDTVNFSLLFYELAA